MKLLPAILAHPSCDLLPNDTQQATQHPQKPMQWPQQQTLCGFIQQKIIPSGPPTEPITINAELTPKNPNTPLTPAATPQSTPLPTITPPPQSQQSQYNACSLQTQPQQWPLHHDHRSNNQWGNCWTLWQPTNLFQVVSKNTSTSNLHNLDMLAITKELMLLSVSIFTAQETNNTGMKTQITTSTLNVDVPPHK